MTNPSPTSRRVSKDDNVIILQVQEPKLPIQGGLGSTCFTCNKVQILFSDPPHIPCGYCLRGWFCHDGPCWNEGPCCVNHAAEVDIAMSREYRSKSSLSAMFPEPPLPSGKPLPEVIFTPMLIEFSRPSVRSSGPPVVPPAAPPAVQPVRQQSISGIQRSGASLGEGQVAVAAYPPYRPPHFFQDHEHRPVAVRQAVQEKLHSYPVEDPTQPGGYHDSSTFPAPTTILSSQSTRHFSRWRRYDASGLASGGVEGDAGTLREEELRGGHWW